jgi:hypothetical protein
MSDRCPPHNFHVAASWEGEQSRGYIYCRACGDIRELAAQDADAPAEERYTESHTITATFEAGE